MDGLNGGGLDLSRLKHRSTRDFFHLQKKKGMNRVMRKKVYSSGKNRGNGSIAISDRIKSRTNANSNRFHFFHPPPFFRLRSPLLVPNGPHTLLSLQQPTKIPPRFVSAFAASVSKKRKRGMRSGKHTHTYIQWNDTD